MAAAAIIFFAFYGFDAIATAAEEAKNPGRDLAIGIVGSMVVCVIIYMAVAAAAIGALAYTRFANSPEPLALILRELGQPLGGPLPRRLGGDRAADRDPRLLLRPEPDLLRHGPRRPAAAAAWRGSRAAARRCGSPCSPPIVVAALAGIVPLDELAALANAGTLTAFIAVCVCMLVMRRRAPDAPRKFRTPLRLAGRARSAILGCLYLFYSLPLHDPALVPVRPRRRAGHLFRLRGAAERGVARASSRRRPDPVSRDSPSPLRRSKGLRPARTRRWPRRAGGGRRRRWRNRRRGA